MNNQQRHPVIKMSCAVILVMIIGGCEKSEGIVSSEDRLASVTAEVMDMELAHAVTVALANEAALVDADIAVAATNGEVQLTGVVDNEALHSQAIRIAVGVAGVNVVSDKLAVKEQQ
jgi:osmotically-inducible protein OsmY